MTSFRSTNAASRSFRSARSWVVSGSSISFSSRSKAFSISSAAASISRPAASSSVQKSLSSRRTVSLYSSMPSSASSMSRVRSSRVTSSSAPSLTASVMGTALSTYRSIIRDRALTASMLASAKLLSCRFRSWALSRALSACSEIRVMRADTVSEVDWASSSVRSMRLWRASSSVRRSSSLSEDSWRVTSGAIWPTMPPTSLRPSTAPRLVQLAM